jgi:hypothetical protein
MAQQIVNLEKLAEAQAAADAAVEAADAAMEAATLAAEKVAEVAPQVANLEKPAKAQEADGGEMADGYRIIQNGPEDFSVEGFFRQDGSQRFRQPRGFPPRSRRASGFTTSSVPRTGDAPSRDKVAG